MRQGPSNHSTRESFITERHRQIPSSPLGSSPLWFLPVLITEHPPIPRLIVADHMRTQEPASAVIQSHNGPVLNRRRSQKAVNFLWRLFDGRTRRTHLPQDSVNLPSG